MLPGWNQSRHAQLRSSDLVCGTTLHIGAPRSTPRVRADTYRSVAASPRLTSNRHSHAWMSWRSSTRRRSSACCCFSVPFWLRLRDGRGHVQAGETSTDNAYIRGDATSLAPRVAGYVTTVEVADNQTVRAGDVLFRIDDRDYRARLAQAVANVEAAKARLTNVDAEIRLQHALIRQAEAQRRSHVAEMHLAIKASDRRRELVRSRFVSQALVDESDAARSRAEADVSAASATVEAQQKRIAVLHTQRAAAVATVAQARALRNLARIDLDSTVVRAPVGGVVGNRQVRIGRLVAIEGSEAGPVVYV